MRFALKEDPNFDIQKNNKTLGSLLRIYGILKSISSSKYKLVEITIAIFTLIKSVAQFSKSDL